ncbi:hypothetical protein, partial [Brucella melitensis]|uniref:hypothetical protein n=1 Tax=Brucella melitensis TaxID=29459 RepID=UPI003D2BB698
MSTSHRNKRKPLQPDCPPNIHRLAGTIRIVIPSAFSARWISLVFKHGNSPHIAKVNPDPAVSRQPGLSSFPAAIRCESSNLRPRPGQTRRLQEFLHPYFLLTS